MAEERFVDKYQVELIQRVTNITPVVDALITYDVINKKSYDKIVSFPDSEGKMRAIFSGPLEASGGERKKIFFNILEVYEPHLMDDLKRMEYENFVGKVRVETRAAKMLIFETLNKLSFKQLDEFKSLVEREKGFPLVSRSRLKEGKTQDVAELMVETFGQDCVDVTKKILKEMKRTDLVRRLSEVSFGITEKHSVDEQLPTLTQREETMASVIELLLETLSDLRDEEIKDFREKLQRQIHYDKRYSDFTWSLHMINLQDTVFLMVQTYGQQSVETTKRILEKMHRTDLVQRLSDSSSGPTKKVSADKHGSALIQKVAAVTAVKHMLLEILSDLSVEELEEFNSVLKWTDSKWDPSDIQWMLGHRAHRSKTVDLMLETYSQQSVKVTKKVLKNMKRTDLVQRLSETSPGTTEKHSVDEQLPTLIQREETMASVIELLLETLSDLRDEEIKDFREKLQRQIHYDKRYSDFTWSLHMINLQDTVFLMVQTYGQQSVEMTESILEKMHRTDLVQRLSDSSSGPTKKPSVDEHLSALIHKSLWAKLTQKYINLNNAKVLRDLAKDLEKVLRGSSSALTNVAAMAAVKELLWETLTDLRHGDVEKFKWFLQLTCFQRGLPYIPWRRLKDADRATKVVNLMVETCGHQSVEVIMEVLMDMNKTDLVQRLSETSSGFKASGSSAEVSGVRTTEGVKRERCSALIQKEETMASVIELLLETLSDFRDEEIKDFKKKLQRQIQYDKRYLDFTLRLLPMDLQDTVFLMVQTSGQQSVETTKMILERMHRTDLVQRLSDSSSGPTKKVSADKHRSALIQKVAAVAALKHLLLEILSDLSDEELEEFNSVLKWTDSKWTDSKWDTSDIRWMLGHRADRSKTVDLMLETYNQQSVEVTKKVLKNMNRTDLVQRLSETSPGTTEKHPVDEQLPTLIQREETMASVIELLLETLSDLRDEEIEDFREKLQRQIHYDKRYLDFTRSLLKMDLQDTVFLLVQTYGQQSVETTKMILEKMHRTDLVQRLSDSSSGPTKKPSVDEHLSALIHKVAAMAAVKKLLWETLTDLRHGDVVKFKWFLQLTCFQRGLPYIPWRRLMFADRATKVVNLMVETCGQQSVEVIMEVLMDMNKTDLVQRLSETSSGFKVKRERCSALIQKEETMASVIELLLETLSDLRDKEIKDFREKLQRQIQYDKRYLDFTLRLLPMDLQDTVFLMVQTYGQQSVETTKMILEKMHRTDLVQRLSDSSSGPTNKVSADKRRSALIQKVAAVAAVKHLLMETLNDLSKEEFEKFNKVLLTNSKWDTSNIQWMFGPRADRSNRVDLMLETYGQQSVEETRTVLKQLNRTDLVQRLSETSSGPKEKQSVDEDQPAPFERVPATDAVKHSLLETLNHFHRNELQKFKMLLQFANFQKGLPQIAWRRPEFADGAEMVDLMVDLMVELWGQQSVEVTREIFRDMNRTDLVQKLSETGSGPKGPSRSLEQEACGSTVQESSNWTKLEPEVNSTDADEAPTYSLQSEAGNFECSVSDLRWVCKEKVSFKYQFCSWEGHMERMESRQYMPAGPLMDVTVIAGKLDEVYLPHWICIDDNPKILDKFAVLHIDDCGDVVEKVSEITSSHIKLREPVFSPRAALMKIGFPVKIRCNVLIYKTNTDFLTLHVYLIPLDPALKQAVEKIESDSKFIQKPYPERPLKMHDRFILTADVDSAEIEPKKLELRYESRYPNFFEMFIENPCRNFNLSLTHKDERQPLWNCVIRKGDYQATGKTQGNDFVDKHQCDLIDRVRNIGPILDHLKSEGVIQQEDYDQIRATPTTQEKMRKLYAGPLKAGGHKSKDIFYRILEEKEPYLVADLKRKES